MKKTLAILAIFMMLLTSGIVFADTGSDDSCGSGSCMRITTATGPNACDGDKDKGDGDKDKDKGE